VAPLSTDASKPLPLGLPAWAWSVLALLVGLAGSYLVAAGSFRQQQQERREQLATIAERGYASIAERLRGCELLVRSVQTVFLSSDEITPDEFQHVFSNLRPHEIFPSLQALAFARRVPREDGDHYITDMVAPLAGNEGILGLDINTQPSNFRGALRSRDDNRPALSAPFRLRQQPAAERGLDGVTLRLPVYSKGPPPERVGERRARMTGSLAASFRLSRLIPTAVPPEARELLHVVVEDVTDASRVPLYDSHPGPHGDRPPGAGFERVLAYGGRTWRIRMHPLEDAAAPVWPWTTFAIGVLASVLLALLAWTIATTRRQALLLGERMSRSYRDSEERFRALNELLPALVLLARRDDGRILYANQAARDRLGGDVEQVDLADVFEDPALRLRLGSGGGGLSNTEALLRSINGDRFWASVSISEVSVGGESKLLMVASDISEQRQLTELLSYQASHDALTELFNRREFERQVEHALSTLAAGGPPAALLYIDLDQFKLINDTSGHIAGDQLLTQLAEVMREQLRGADVLARLGGDEFGVLAPGSHREGAMLLAERLRARIDAFDFVWEQRSYAISASIGVVMVEDADSTLKDVFALADTACYMAKESGRNRVHLFSPHDDATSRRRGEMEWANRLRGIVEEGRLLLYYQELRPLDGTDRSSHIELLLRLRDENGEVVMPGAFLPAAERFGLMPLIDRWVIETALANFNRLHAVGPELALCAINLSGASIDDESFAERILDWLQSWQVDPRRVCFEVTETFAVRNMAQTVRFIERLRGVGCRIALDDFGAGMSSFGYLKNLPIDMIKIDGSFIRDMAHDPMSLAIVRAIADIGHQRGLEIIAEWVPDAETVAALREIGVDYAQGFGLHRPEPALFQRG
jgi:diguanylate cyclase (GGDEF)-like protein/PAS domain S-box-containing protein